MLEEKPETVSTNFHATIVLYLLQFNESNNWYS